MSGMRQGKEPGDTFAAAFYHSRAWAETRRAYRAMAGGLCERCLARGIVRAGDEVHHKIKLTPENINDPRITLSFDNLELLCAACHHDEHRKAKRWKIEEGGRLIIRDDPPAPVANSVSKPEYADVSLGFSLHECT